VVVASAAAAGRPILGHKKRAAVAGGSKVKQGGVKQSGQEPLDVQKMDNASNEGESLITR
jgi:hypothetical protein